MSLVFVCDSGYRDRLRFPHVGHFESRPGTVVPIGIDTDNYALATPYDWGGGTLGTDLQTCGIAHERVILSDDFYAGHVLNIFSGGGRTQHRVTASTPTTTTTTALRFTPPSAATAGPVGYWLSQEAPLAGGLVADVESTSSVVVHGGISPGLRTDAPLALLVYTLDGAGVPVQPTVSYVRGVAEVVPATTFRVTVAGTIAHAVGSSVRVDIMHINGLTNGNNVGNTRWSAQMFHQMCLARRPFVQAGANLFYRVQLHHVIFPTQVPIRTTTPEAGYDHRDPDAPRHGGYITEFPYVVVQLSVNGRYRPQHVIVPSQASVSGTFIAIMEPMRSHSKPFVVAHCHGSVVLPAEEWDTITVTVSLPNGDILDFERHPAMSKRIMYAGPDPLSQLQCIFYVECVGPQ
jgi:hypothetical protein